MHGILEFLQQALHSYCHACRLIRLQTGSLCPRCASYLASLSNFSLMRNIIGEESFTVYSIGYYAADLAKIILNNKQNPSNTVIMHLTAHLMDRLPKPLRKMTIIQVPGSNRQPEHLVDALTLELSKRGWKSPESAIIQRRLFNYGMKSHKNMNQIQRHQSEFNRKYVLYRSNIQELKGKSVVLLDDICTTGATLLSFKKALESQGVRVNCAVTLAYTPKYF